MANVKFLYENITGATLTASAGTATGYDLENTKDRNPNTKWRSAAITNNQEFRMQFPTARAANTIIIDGINGTALAAGSIEIYVQSSPNGSAWTTRHTFTDESIASGVTRLKGELVATTTETYWRLVFTDSGASLAAAPEIGSVFIGVRFEPALPYDAGTERGEKYETTVVRALDKTPYATQTVDDGIDQFKKLIWSSVNSTIMIGFLKLNYNIRGRLRAFYFMDTDDKIYLVVLLRDVVIAKHNRYDQYDIDIEFEAFSTGTIAAILT